MLLKESLPTKLFFSVNFLKQAVFHRAACLFLGGLCFALFTASEVVAQKPGNRGQELPDVREIDQAEGQRLIEAFRRQRLIGDYIFDFELEHRPFRGKEKTYQGTLWGSWNAEGPINRLVLYPDLQRTSFQLGLLTQGGRTPELWQVEAGGESQKLALAKMTQPLIDGFLFTPFDVVMPFVHWPESVYEGSKRVRGHPAHLFQMTPPESFKKDHPEVAHVRIVLHARYNALMNVDVLDASGKVIRSMKMGSFKKVNEQYIIKTIDLKDKVTGDVTRFRVRAAAVGLRLPIGLFDAEDFAAGIPQTPEYRMQRL